MTIFFRLIFIALCLFGCQSDPDQAETEPSPANQTPTTSALPPESTEQSNISLGVNAVGEAPAVLPQPDTNPRYEVPVLEESEELFFVLFNSVGSCAPANQNPDEDFAINETPLTQNFASLKSKIDQRLEKPSETFITCFTDEQQSDEMYFRSSVGRGYTISANIQGITDSLLHYHRPNQTVVLIGYEYGGWLALKVANELINRNVKSILYTIEAISKDNCNHILSSKCRKIPNDIDGVTLQYIADNSLLWGNFYQKFTLPRSSSTKIKDRANHYNTNLFRSSHNKIVSSDRLWNRVEQDLSKAFDMR